MSESLLLGIDIGSTTAKIVLAEPDGAVIHSGYRRHHAAVFDTLLSLLEELPESCRDGSPVTVLFTGTAGMGIAERTGLPFVQEVSASAEMVRTRLPEVRTFIDLGGEDAKIIFFDEHLRPDIRMNGNCAGGTGAFIDQMAALLDIPVERLSAAAARRTAVYSIASRCGVFAKTDIQNLLSRDVSPENIAASIYRAVAFQLISSLARGVAITPKLLFAGGPFHYQPELKRTFLEVVGFHEADTIDPQQIDPLLTPDLIPAAGAALRSLRDGTAITLSQLVGRISQTRNVRILKLSTLEPLFADREEWVRWEERKTAWRLKTVSFEELRKTGGELYLGIDSGSTTTKIVVIDSDGRLAFTWYAPNKGTSVETVYTGLRALREEIRERAPELTFCRTAVTGYGEDLIRFAFSIDEGHVETIAHFRGASFFEPDVSFILDIGGQDMKAIFVKDQVITNIELNESCSSGSGSFIQTFAASMGLDVAGFAEAACLARHPHDLGTRCTVFMNSKVKQVLREGGEIGDISAGLAYSVIRNCLNKVLKITDANALGPHVVVQGGTFRNPAVLRAMELVTGRSVIRPDRAELMGAWGAALIARDAYQNGRETVGGTIFPEWDSLERALQYEKRTTLCRGCENSCEIAILTYGPPSTAPRGGKPAADGREAAARQEPVGRDGPRRFYTGNKCEKFFSNQPDGLYQGSSLVAFKRKLLFDRPVRKAGTGAEPRLRIGIPRVLNLWEDYPFWATLLVEAGFEVVLSDTSTISLAEKGYSTVMSENICFPAKLTNGHILNLMEKQVDRIFFPKVRYTAEEYRNVINRYNCPIVTGYPQVIESSIDPLGRFGIPFDAPPVGFHDRRLLRRICVEYLLTLGADRNEARRAFSAAVREQESFRRRVREEAARITARAAEEGRRVIVLAGRPYHADALVNMKIPEIISDLGLDVITEDSIPRPARALLPKVQVLTQWTFHNRLFHAAHWVGRQKHVELIQLNSFGCGPDALTVDEVKSILNEYGKNSTLIKIDEMTSPGSVRLRIRSLVESLKRKPPQSVLDRIPRLETRIFRRRDKGLTVLAPQFSPFYTDFIIAAYRHQGYRIEILPMGDRESIELGLRYSNNDICYPATIVIGDLLKALRSGRYDLTKVAVGLTQTGGQCRASSYVSLLKRALLKAGYDTIPVVTASTTTRGRKSMNEQPGFRVRTLPFALTALYGMLFGDVMAKLFYYASVREVKKGSAMKLVEQFIEEGKALIDHRARHTLFKLIRRAVEAFNQLPMDHSSRPRVGIVGEIYVKFNPFGNLYTADWLIDRGIQPEVPPLIDFFLIPLMSTPYNARKNIDKVKQFVIHLLSRAEGYINRLLQHANGLLEEFAGELTPFHPIRTMADRASGVIDLINQFGESWLLAGDIATFAEEGVDTVVCLQPFGCIANHVIARGIERRMKERYPQLNLLFLDMDSGMSEVNVVNRMEFIVDGLKAH